MKEDDITRIENGVLYNLKSGDSVIPEGVTTIEPNLFRGSYISKIVLPRSLKKIGHGAFESCKNLKEIVLPDGIDYIGHHAFAFSGIEKLDIPDSADYIGINAFAHTPWIEKHKNDEFIIFGSFLHLYNGSADEVTVPHGIRTIGDGAFGTPRNYDEGARGKRYPKKVQLPDTVETIGHGAFYYCRGLREINLPKGLKTIDYEAFSGCRMLDLLLPDSLTKIGPCSFSGTKIKKADIPSGVSLIEASAFYRCSELCELNIAEGVEAIGQNAFEWCEQLSSVSIPRSVDAVRDYAFANCEQLSNVILPSPLPDIGEKAFMSTPWQKKQKSRDY